MRWEERGQSISAERTILNKRSGVILGELPDDEITFRDCGGPVLILTCTVDVQTTCLWVHVVGWCAGGTNWTIDWFKIDGDPANKNDQCWKELDKFITNKIYTNKDRSLKIWYALIDSGHVAPSVYNFCQPWQNVYPCKGQQYIAGNKPWQEFSKETLEKAAVEHGYILNTVQYKDNLSAYLRLNWNTRDIQPDWYFNYPEDLGSEFFEQLENEERLKIYDKLSGDWRKTIWKATGDNHAMDTTVYNLAAIEILAFDICRSYGYQLSWDFFWKWARDNFENPNPQQQQKTNQQQRQSSGGRFLVL
jgi:phage terminase large subunit GpA-like protein